MFEKIASAAERLATNVSESRRGFLTRVGRGALGVAGVLAGLLALPGKAQAQTIPDYCQVSVPGTFYSTRPLNGYCVCPTGCFIRFNPTRCSGSGSGIAHLCATYVSSFRGCFCTV
jgi:hypothetical protein